MKKIYVQVTRIKNGMGFEQPCTTLTTIVGQPKKKVNTNPVDELAKKLLKLSASEEDVVRGIREKFPNMTESAARMVIAEVKDPNRKGLNPKGFKQNGWAETDIMPQLPSDRKRTKEPGYTKDLKNAEKFKVGDEVRHKNDPDNTVGEIITISRSKSRPIKVNWEIGEGDYYDPEELVKNSSFTKDLAVAERRGGSADKKTNKDIGGMVKLLQRLEEQGYGRKRAEQLLVQQFNLTVAQAAKEVDDYGYEPVENSDRLKPTDVQSEVNSKKR